MQLSIFKNIVFISSVNCDTGKISIFHHFSTFYNSDFSCSLHAWANLGLRTATNIGLYGMLSKFWVFRFPNVHFREHFLMPVLVGSSGSAHHNSGMDDRWQFETNFDAFCEICETVRAEPRADLFSQPHFICTSLTFTCEKKTVPVSLYCRSPELFAWNTTRHYNHVGLQLHVLVFQYRYSSL